MKYFCKTILKPLPNMAEFWQLFSSSLLPYAGNRAKEEGRSAEECSGFGSTAPKEVYENYKWEYGWA